MSWKELDPLYLRRPRMWSVIWREAAHNDLKAMERAAVVHTATRLASGASPEALIALAEAAPWVMLTGTTAFVLERPLELHVNREGNLHRTDGPAVRFADGWALWAVDGVVLPRRALEDPASIDVHLALLHSNLEVRQRLLELVGWERIVALAEPGETITDEYGTLHRIRQSSPEPVVLVEVENATAEPDGSRRRYFLRVPPHTRSPREAVAWTFDMGPERYAPEAES
jgi:hypothetical protein